MPKEYYSDLLALAAVARQRNFTRAAAELGVSQSMLSQTVKTLEARLGVRLLTRTTRSVSVTEAGGRLLTAVMPRLEAIEAELCRIIDLKDTPAGTVRFSAPEHAINTILWPKLSTILSTYAQINYELHPEEPASSFAGSGYDFGVLPGDELDDNVTAVRIGPDVEFAIVGAPDYLQQHPEPEDPDQLAWHDCIGLRHSNRGGMRPWRLNNGMRDIKAHASGRLTFSSSYQALNAALCAAGLACVPLDLARAHLDAGRLLPVLEHWWPKAPGYHLFYLSKQRMTPAMQVISEALRYER